jgi:hypothetical protein
VRGAAALALHRLLDQPWTARAADDIEVISSRVSAPRATRRGREVAIGRR